MATTRVTVEQYHAMARAGAFEPRERHHVELLEGEILPMSPVGPAHRAALTALTDWSYDALPREAILILVRQPIALAESESEPEPDLAWARRKSYPAAHPTAVDLFLVVEISERSLELDRGRKAGLYARAGVAVYWLINLVGRTVEVRRGPRDGCYQSVTVYGPGETVSPLAFPAAVLHVDRLFPD